MTPAELLETFDALDLAEIYFTRCSEVGPESLIEPLMAKCTPTVSHGKHRWVISIRAEGGEGVVVCDAYANSTDNAQWLLDLASARLGMSQIPFVF